VQVVFSSLMYIVEHGNEEAEEEIREGFKNVPCSLWYTLLMLSGMWELLLVAHSEKRRDVSF
jgi:hypothetical protein